MNVWDTAGQERYHSITKSVVRKAQGIVLVYAINDRQSYERVSGWLRDIFDFCGDESVKIVLVGNKCDLGAPADARREVPASEGQEFAARHELPFFETSAIANINVDEVSE
jgi:small GTP-binding protein